ncbi:MAG: 3-hydroxyacyl-CoA dehydrogenase [uncultured archaeon A07HB70]|nr:MAG: 3-hydroxyacyl-CoA dehydrogenase [uncultured archaeon A07HB70]
MHVTVLGAGTMGAGIAGLCARSGHETWLRDVDPEALDAARDRIAATYDDAVERGLLADAERHEALARVEATTDLEEAAADATLVVEAVPERLDLKREVAEEAAAAAPAAATLATNTSSLSVTAVAAALDRPERFVGLHFFNPPHAMQLVEVVRGERTADSTASFAVDFVEGLDRTPIVVDDTPGFATSRLGVALGAEAMRMVEQGVAAPADIDRAMELGYNHPVGPLELTDVVGLDVRLDVLEGLREELGERFRPPQVLRRKVRAGKLGKKTGEGFYIWEGDEPLGRDR